MSTDRVHTDRYYADPDTRQYMYRTVFLEGLYETDSYKSPMTDRIIVPKYDLKAFACSLLEEAGYEGMISFSAEPDGEASEDQPDQQGRCYHRADVNITVMGQDPRAAGSADYIGTYVGSGARALRTNVTIRATVDTGSADIYELLTGAEPARLLHDIGVENDWPVEQLSADKGEFIVEVTAPAGAILDELEGAVGGDRTDYYVPPYPLHIHTIRQDPLFDDAADIQATVRYLNMRYGPTVIEKIEVI